MALSDIDYAARARAAGLNVYMIAEGDRDYHIRTQTVNPANPCCNGYSIAKAFTVTATGLLYDRGLLTPETRVVEVLGDLFPKDADERWGEVTLHHLMLHRAGLAGDCADIDNEDGTSYPKGTDYLQGILASRLPYSPGSTHHYTDAVFYLLSRVLQRISGKDAADLLRPYLMDVMGYREFAWSVCPKGYCIGASGLYLRTADLVKMGILYLNGGDWQGKRVISQEWVDLVLSRGYELKAQGNGWYAKGGLRGQMLALNPSLGRAVAWHAYEPRGFFHEIIPAP